MAFEIAGKDQILLLGEAVLRSLRSMERSVSQADGAIAHYLFIELQRRSLDGILDGDLATSLYG